MIGLFDNWETQSWHNKDIPEAKFKIGEMVVYHGIFESLHATYGVVGVGWADGPLGDPLIEYALRGFPYLVWEDELTKE